MDWAAAIIGVGSGIVAAGASISVAVLAFKPQMRTATAAEVTASSEFQKALNEGFAALGKLQAEQISGLSAQVSSLETLVRDMDSHMVDLEVAIAARGMPVPQRRFGHAAATLQLVPREGEG